MTKERLDGLYFMVLGSVVFLLLGFVFENATSHPFPMTDFKGLYYPARCLIRHCDPYLADEVQRIYQAEGGSRPWDSAMDRQIATQNPYPPTIFAISVPLAMLPWGPAHLLWIMLTVGSLIFVSFLIWNLGADYAPVVSGFLIGFLLANSQFLVLSGNAAGIAISLCIFAVWSFLTKRFEQAGVLCLAISLAIKPHDTGLVWLYFLLAGGVYRKRALQTLLATVALSLPAILWVWRVSPQWMQEMHSNILAYSAYGGINDPGLSSTGGHGFDMLINLQTAVSVFWNNPRVYNPASYLVCVLMLLVWAFVTLRSRCSPTSVWLALAPIAALSMLPVYHRQHDAKLLLLTVPACALLWAKGGWTGWLAFLVNSAGFIVIADFPWVIFFGLASNLHPSTTVWPGQILNAVHVIPAPFVLLIMSVFYLWVYVRRVSGQPADSAHGARRDAVMSSFIHPLH